LIFVFEIFLFNIQSDEAGSIADLGLKPGGRVRMTQTSSIQIKQSIHMARLIKISSKKNF
jgi:hypothetical protein